MRWDVSLYFFFFGLTSVCFLRVHLLFVLSCHAVKFEQRNRMYRIQATVFKFCPYFNTYHNIRRSSKSRSTLYLTLMCNPFDGYSLTPKALTFMSRIGSFTLILNLIKHILHLGHYTLDLVRERRKNSYIFSSSSIDEHRFFFFFSSILS